MIWLIIFLILYCIIFWLLKYNSFLNVIFYGRKKGNALYNVNFNFLKNGIKCTDVVVPLGVGWYYTVIKKIVTVFIVFGAGEKWVGFGDKTSFQGILCGESLSRLEGSASQPSYSIWEFHCQSLKEKCMLRWSKTALAHALIISPWPSWPSCSRFRRYWGGKNDLQQSSEIQANTQSFSMEKRWSGKEGDPAR